MSKRPISEKATPRDPRQNPNFVKWFEGSQVVNSDGSPKVMYHGTSGDFDTFDVEKIKANETDAPFNGFWFSSDHETSPAFHDPTNIMPVYLAIKNPAPWKVWRAVAREVSQDFYDQKRLPKRSRTTQDETRFRLIEAGYDGIIFDKQPDIDAEALDRDGEVEFRSVRGGKYKLKKSKTPEMEWGKIKAKAERLHVTVTDASGHTKELPDARRPQDIINYIIVYGVEKVDHSQFDFHTGVGTVKFDNGRVLKSELVSEDYEYDGLRNTGREMDQLDYYCDHIGHLTGYADLQDFIKSHEDETWVCFYPTQIKSVYNRGDWSPNSLKVTEGTLNEGLIPIPPRMLANAMKFYRREILHWARDQLKGKAEQFPVLVAELKRLTKQYMPDGMPRGVYGNTEKKPIRAQGYKLNLEGMPDRFREMTPAADSYYAVLDWRTGGDSRGGWHPNRHAIVIYPLAPDWMKRYPQRGAEDSLTHLFKEIEATVTHEIRHAVQTLLLEPKSTEQVRRHSGYKDRTDNPASMVDYFTSPIEFDPTIGSCAAEFVRDIELFRGYGKKIDLGDAMRQFTGLKPTKFFDHFRCDPFFMVLRKKAPAKYKIAIKKFMAEVERLLDDKKVNEALMEIEKIGDNLEDQEEWKTIQTKEFDPRQQELFAEGSPYQHEGSFAGYDVATMREGMQFKFSSFTQHSDGPTYIVFKSGTPVAYVVLKSHYHAEDDDLECYRVSSIRVADSEQGKGLAPRLYRWFVTDGHIDCLFADEQQTNAGAALWRRLLHMDGIQMMSLDNFNGTETPVYSERQLLMHYKYTNMDELYITKAHGYVGESAEERECRTPGAVYDTEVHGDSLTAKVNLPDEVQIGDMSDEQGEALDDAVHDALEAIVADLVDELDPDAALHWKQARENDQD